MWLSVFMDAVVAVLLGVTIFYCFMVDRRLRALRSGKDELKVVIEALGTSTDRAQESVLMLKNSGNAIEEQLDTRIRDARALSDELSLMIEAGNNLADRLEGSRPGARKPEKDVTHIGLAAANEGQRATQSNADDREYETRSPLENELLNALRQAR